MLEVKNLHVEVGGREVLHGVSLTIQDGHTHVLLGPNGSGKTTLLRTIMGFGSSKVTEGSIIFNGVDVTNKPVHERARLGMGIMFQRPPTISGLKLGKFINATTNIGTECIPELADKLHMTKFMDRDVNAGFSGGEIKRSEILQLTVQNPSFVMLDEPESGVDVENMSLLGNAAAALLQKDQHIVSRTKSGLIITHTGYILDYIEADVGHVLIDGYMRCSGNPREILKSVKASGYKECVACQK
ncbi:MAG TPA: ABC transporter ATP-binding protein [Methanocorpusculum sp.]|nr:ABC transporter ATP-binding protein [Methanocorpusculum sp.]HJJ39696.1 ABC transporter ATP-binding protein [Methanocorpusculum sp.]HJJ49305.1 ABC transporter ATP-binding protein [Methanocorpusculum sp.]HJJ56651.1 ABC transporter ATP-binding protein [Methanocorpusculum sp.]HJJ95214.1 ABC transporter ATP-binding protein [Methanocorpusculum sp.]